MTQDIPSPPIGNPFPDAKAIGGMYLPVGKTAVIVAHPDDESLWSGGLLARTSGLDVICCSVPYRDPERVLGFCKVMKLLGHHPILIPFSEQSATAPLTHLELLDLNDYETIITHNASGEYGHPHHIQVHKYIHMRFPGNIYCFGYKSGDIVLLLNESEQAQKRAALHCYDRPSETEARGGITKSEAWMKLYDLDLSSESYLSFAVNRPKK